MELHRGALADAGHGCPALGSPGLPTPLTHSGLHRFLNSSNLQLPLGLPSLHPPNLPKPLPEPPPCPAGVSRGAPPGADERAGKEPAQRLGCGTAALSPASIRCWARRALWVSPTSSWVLLGVTEPISLGAAREWGMLWGPEPVLYRVTFAAGFAEDAAG